MTQIINDSVFGKLYCEDGDVQRNEKIEFWGKIYNITIDVNVYEGEKINDMQRDNYKYFKENLSFISTKSLIRVKEFMLYTFNDDFWGAPDDSMTISDVTDEYIKKVVIPKMILFQDDGRAGIICDYEWNDYGIGIKFKPEFEISSQDSLF